MKRIIVRLAEIPKQVCNNVVGKHHTKSHRKLCGICFILIGVILAESQNWLGHPFHQFGDISCDAVGYALHGIGLTPFIVTD